MFGNGKIFVSHTHEDNAACERVLAALDAWQVDYWFDTAQLSAGLELLDNIQRGLAGRDIYLRICTPAANGSPWMAQEQKLARTLRAPNRGQRLMIDLIVKPGYVVAAEEAHDLVIDTTQQPEVEWLRRLREALEIPSRERRVSRRALLGVGVTSLAALGGMGLAGKLLFFTPAAARISICPLAISRPPPHCPAPSASAGRSRSILSHLEAPPVSFCSGRRWFAVTRGHSPRSTAPMASSSGYSEITLSTQMWRLRSWVIPSM